MELPEHFRQFLQNIRPTANQKRDARDAHRRLRQRVTDDEGLDEHVIGTLLQGSYRRSTDIRPVGEKKSDVDIIVVTNMHENHFSPAEALLEFRPFLERHYKGCYEPQDRSWGIVDGEVELDLVPTSAPSEAIAEQVRALRESDLTTELGIEQYGLLRESFRAAAERSRLITEALAKGDAWNREPLRIPDRKQMEWHDTHPVAQNDWTQQKNSDCNSHYVDVVRCFKWWRLNAAGEVHPKGYPLEALVGENCPDGITSIATGFAATAASVIRKYSQAAKPQIWDHGVQKDVLARVTDEQWVDFYQAVWLVAGQAERALAETDKSVCVARWCDIFGDQFPNDDDGGSGQREFLRPTGPATAVGRGRFA